jgi:CTP:molybdopterin cytidylyltransferase MocA
VDFATMRPAKICQPIRNGHCRHPVIFPRAIFFELATASAANLKDFLVSRCDHLAGFDVDDPGLDLDLDTPADYAALVSLRDK